MLFCESMWLHWLNYFWKRGEQMLDKNGHILIKGEGGQIEKRAGSNKGV